MRQRLLAVAILAAVVSLGVVVLPAAAQAEDLPGGWVSTPTGPLGPADRDFLVRVRTAGLWEGPAGDMAQTRAGAERVKEVGVHLKTDHTGLDEQVRAIAAQLGVTLPDQPTAEQQGWLGELASRTGQDFDRTFADRLRAAHGKVFAVVALIRSGTRNDTIRAFAQTAINVVMKHMTLLESIGLVNYEALPSVPPPPPPGSNLASRAATTGINPNLVWLVLGIALVAGLVTAARVVRPRRSPL